MTELSVCVCFNECAKTAHRTASSDVPIDRGSTGSRGSFDPPLLEVGGQAMLFDPPLFPCVKIHHILLLCSVILLVVSFTCFQVRNNKNILSSLDWSSIRCFHWSVLTALQVQWLAAPLLFTLLLYFIIYIYGFEYWRVQWRQRFAF